MSRTYKDKKWELRFPQDDWSFGTEDVPAVFTYRNWYTKEVEHSFGSIRVNIAGARAKQKRSKVPQQNFPYSTPSWWIREFMTVPKRAKCRNWAKDAVRFQDIEDAGDCPDYGNKPHFYYW